GGREPSGAEGLARGRRSPMRLLPVGTDHGRRGSARRQSEADRRRYRCSDDQYLPLRHLSAHSDCRSPRRQYWPGLRRAIMTAMLTGRPRLSRRGFLIGTAAAGGGLALGLPVPGLKDALAQSALGAEGNEVGAW